MKIITYLLLLSLILIANASAEEIGQKKYGVVYNIADDRKVEKIGGIYEPEGIDKYVKRRFDSVDQRLDEIDQKISALKDELLKAIAEMNKKKKSILVS